jgi:hypothetical protein
LPGVAFGVGLTGDAVAFASEGVMAAVEAVDEAVVAVLGAAALASSDSASFAEKVDESSAATVSSVVLVCATAAPQFGHLS